MFVTVLVVDVVVKVLVLVLVEPGGAAVKRVVLLLQRSVVQHSPTTY